MNLRRERIFHILCSKVFLRLLLLNGGFQTTDFRPQIYPLFLVSY